MTPRPLLTRHKYVVRLVATNTRAINRYQDVEYDTMNEAVIAATQRLVLLNGYGVNVDLACVTLTITRRVIYE